MKRFIGSLYIGSLILFSCRDSTFPQEEGAGAEVNQAYSGAGYVGGFAQPGASVLFVVEAIDEGEHTLEVRYATTHEQAATASLYINGYKAPEQLQMPEQPAGDNWQSIERSVRLKKGTNTIVIQHDAADNGLFNLDYIQIKR